jgi:quinol-cytochrome oxidoreductase complex cytochrome b subunit
MTAAAMDIGERIRCGDEAIGAWLDRVFPAPANPWRHLGGLAFLFFVACIASGTYAYALFDTSLAGAYESGRALTADKHLAGRLVRGLHRYSADAFALATALHLAREAARGHFRAFRAWSWLSGLVLVPLAWIAGITGFWLAWDERALFSAAATAEWLAAWPWRMAVFARNFLSLEAVSDRFFSLAIFVHIGVPLFALAATWAHLLRLSHVRAWPPRSLGIGSVAALAALSLAAPVASLGPADPLAAPATVAIDWFFLFPHAIADAITPAGLTLAILAFALAAVAMPWTRRRARRAAAVDLANCNGCARCAADCPFGAVVMAPRSDARPHTREARVIPDLCSACGICAGACPSSTPFRRRAPLASGIDLAQRTVASLRDDLDRALAAGREPIVFACPQAASPPGSIAVECAAMVPPAFVQYALRRGAAGVILAACREGDCEHRLGDRWVRERFAGRRAPVLRAAVPRDRVRVAFCGSDGAMLERAALELKPRSDDERRQDASRDDE